MSPLFFFYHLSLSSFKPKEKLDERNRINLWEIYSDTSHVISSWYMTNILCLHSERYNRSYTGGAHTLSVISYLFQSSLQRLNVTWAEINLKFPIGELLLKILVAWQSRWSSDFNKFCSGDLKQASSKQRLTDVDSVQFLLSWKRPQCTQCMWTAGINSSMARIKPCTNQWQAPLLFTRNH